MQSQPQWLSLRLCSLPLRQRNIHPGQEKNEKTPEMCESHKQAGRGCVQPLKRIVSQINTRLTINIGLTIKAGLTHDCRRQEDAEEASLLVRMAQFDPPTVRLGNPRTNRYPQACAAAFIA